MATKSSNPFQSNGWNYLDKLGESSYMPHFYENDLNEATTPSFRSLSPKIYNQQKSDYFTQEFHDEIRDDHDDLYEATLLNSNFLESLEKKPEVTTKPIHRLLQILNHIHPNYSPLSETLSSTPSIRSQFSCSSQQQQQQQAVIPMVAISMSELRDTKGKGKFNPNM